MKKGNIILLSMLLGIIFAFSPTIFDNNCKLYAENNEGIDLEYENVKLSEVSGKIHINNNWTDAETAGICTGDGTYSDPYVIEDLEIDGGGSGSCILIENSDMYFRIENCTLYNSEEGWDEAGIRLDHVNNGQLINNSCSFNSFGIFLSYSDNNNITGNNASYNSFYGIRLDYSDNNNITGNNASYNIRRFGIHLLDSANSIISGNIMNECGLQISGSLDSHTIDTTNLVNGKPLYYYTNEANLGIANFTNAGQVILVNCSDSLISNLNTSYCSTGIYLYSCNDNTISGNTANNNRFGIILSYSDNNNITGNNASYNSLYGIRLLFNCDYNTLLGNTVNYCGANGIDLSYSDSNDILENTADNNQWEGIYIHESDYNYISGNTANNNDEGIMLGDSNYNHILGNTANNNNKGIYLEDSDYNTIVGNFLLGNDECIVEVRCSRNVIENNDCGDTQTGKKPTILGYNLFFLVGVLSVAVILIRKKLKKY